MTIPTIPSVHATAGANGVPFNPRRGIYIDVSQEPPAVAAPLPAVEAEVFERFDLVYRSLCALLYNYVPMSGHPGGSISTGRALAGLLFNVMDYDLSSPQRQDADLVSFAAGHKALGLYAMWALRDEIARLGAPELLPSNEAHRLRLEDLLGFRRNPLNRTPLFVEKRAKPLDGHPTPATPFVRLATGASGVGVGASLGLAFAARDLYGPHAPKVHILEGEGGMTPGRVGEAMAAAATSSVGNAIMHVDWNQASIDSNRVCRDGARPGDYVQWNPLEFAWLHDWNVVYVPDGLDVQQVAAAHRIAVEFDNGQPTAVVCRTTKGWQYGMEGKASHGAGHALCCDAFYEALRPFTEAAGVAIPTCCAAGQPAGSVDSRCRVGADAEVVEHCFWEALTSVREALAADKDMIALLAGRLRAARERLDDAKRRPRDGAPAVEAAYRAADAGIVKVPNGLVLPPGHKTTLRGELGRALNHLNAVSNGAVLVSAADLYGSTSVAAAAKGFDDGFYNAEQNPGARMLSLGGICEDGMTAILSGLATFGGHIGVGSSYGAFSAPLGHIAARLHAIGSQARQAVEPGPYHPFFLVCAHAGVKTGEDGPTHADPQALQLLQGNFAAGTVVTLTPWDPAEVWYLVAAAVAARPAVIAPFVTRPTETVPDRTELGLAPAAMAGRGVYKLYAAEGAAQGAVVLQGSEAAYGFVTGALPQLRAAGIEVDAYYVASAELFDRLEPAEQEAVFPEAVAMRAMGVTGFTLPTMYRWIRSDLGRRTTLHPLRDGRYLGSGKADMVVAEAGLDGDSQFKAIRAYVQALNG